MLRSDAFYVYVAHKTAETILQTVVIDISLVQRIFFSLKYYLKSVRYSVTYLKFSFECYFEKRHQIT
jgi:hypothetical protein